MTKDEVLSLMRSSKSSSEWAANCDKVKSLHPSKFGGQYPEYWYEAVIESGLMDEVLGPGSSDIKITPF